MKQEDKNKAISEGAKRYWQSEEGEEMKKQRSLTAKKYWSNPDARKKKSDDMKDLFKDPVYMEKHLSSKPKGKASPNWVGFIVKAHQPNGDVDEVTFDGDNPLKDALEYGIPVVVQAVLKSGKNYIIKRRSKRTKHSWPVGTVVNAKLIKK